MDLHYTAVATLERGVLLSLLKRSYADLGAQDPEHWGAEEANWEQFDREVFDNPATVGACTFLSWVGGEPAGLLSFDPRPGPAWGIVGHNCIVPEYRGRGFGRQQIREILRRFAAAGIRMAKVSTNDHPFFGPAQRMYAACGFIEVERTPWERDRSQNLIHYEALVG